MADDDDIRELRSGNLDMVRRDFRGGNFRGLKLPGRDFTEAHLEEANMSSSDLSGVRLTNAHLLKFVGDGANLSAATLQSTVVVHASFRSADLRSANFSRSHLAHVDFSGADIRGADFTRAHLEEGTTFEGCVVDETTKFDGARVFRPLSKQEAFRFYRVNRGALERLEEGTNPEAKEENWGVYETTKAPRFQDAAGTATFDFSNNDGRAFLGSNEWTFETRWLQSGPGSVQLILNPPSVVGIGIVGARDSVEGITVAELRAVDFSSQNRRPKAGEVAVLRNAAGYIAVVRILDARSTGHDDPADILAIEYRILTPEGQPVVSDEPPNPQVTPPDALSGTSPNAEILRRIDEVLERLEELTQSERIPAEHGQIGHNQPPEAMPLEEDELRELVTLLKAVRRGAETLMPDPASVEATVSHLGQTAAKIGSWVAQKADLGADEFAKQMGKNLADGKYWVGSWLVLSGQFYGLVDALRALLAG